MKEGGENITTVPKFKVGDVAMYWDENNERAYEWGPIVKVIVDDEFADVNYVDEDGYWMNEKELFTKNAK